MSNLAVSEKSVGGTWDFSTDKGTVGLIPTGVFIPPNAVINRFWINPLTACTGGAGASGGFALGTAGMLLSEQMDISGFVVGEVIPGINFNASPTCIGAIPQQIYFNPTGANWTGGKIAFVCEYTFGDFKFNGSQIINPTPPVNMQTIKTNFRLNPAFNNAGALVFNMFKMPVASLGRIKLISIQLYNKSIASLPDNSGGQGLIAMTTCVYDGTNVSVTIAGAPATVPFGLGSTLSNVGPGVGHIVNTFAPTLKYNLNGTAFLPEPVANANQYSGSNTGSVNNAAVALSDGQSGQGLIIRPTPAVDNFISILISKAPTGGAVGTVGLDAIYDVYCTWQKIDPIANLIAA